MRLLVSLIFLSSIAVASCQSRTTIHQKPAEKKYAIDTAQLGVRFTPLNMSYTAARADIQQKMATGNHTGTDLEHYLLNVIIPYWYGTPWDFNGYTAVPNQGEIACGYFVSTTLEHVGLKINRYKLAQQAGLHEAQSLAIVDRNYETIYGKGKLKRILDERYNDGLYFVGLDNHVGYLYIKHGEYYFIHSNYIDNKVMLEKAMHAPAFQSNVYVVAAITTNEELLNKWRTGERVTVVIPK